MSLQRFYSDGVEQFLAHIRPDGRPAGNRVFPPRFKSASGRIGAESPEEWFCRLVREQLEGKTDQCAIESNLALFAEIEWSMPSSVQLLSRASLQVLAVERDAGSVSRLVSGKPASNHAAHYFRLDYDPDALGAPFTHPMPHVHCRPGDTPRFAVEWSSSGNIIVDFLDFIYRNYNYPKWADWAKAVWCDQFRKDKIRQMLNQYNDIAGAFRKNNYQDVDFSHF